MANNKDDLLQGTLDLLVLKTLQLGQQHGWGISQMIGKRSRDVLLVKEGSLYPALHRLERQGWISAQWGRSNNNRRAKFYALTPLGRDQLQEKTAYWRRFTMAMEMVLAPSESNVE
jgi:PadR family transcriptional regulator PadR